MNLLLLLAPGGSPVLRDGTLDKYVCMLIYAHHCTITISHNITQEQQGHLSSAVKRYSDKNVKNWYIMAMGGARTEFSWVVAGGESHYLKLHIFKVVVRGREEKLSLIQTSLSTDRTTSSAKGRLLIQKADPIGRRRGAFWHSPFTCTLQRHLPHYSKVSPQNPAGGSTGN